MSTVLAIADTPAEVLEAFTCPDCGSGDISLVRGRDSGSVYAFCEGCDQAHPLHDDDQFAAAESNGIAWAEDLARGYAAQLADREGADAEAWSEVLHWAANRLRGGHLSVMAHQEFADRFGLPRDFTPRGDRG